ncbi:MAG: STAS domain-containing protein [Gammaproteobacteria bacterium]|nr:STAS domain-containing protein [Gammaproteobacteria bacterium]
MSNSKQELEILVTNKNFCKLRGKFTREHINAIMPAGEKFITESDSPHFDFALVTLSDSAGVSLLVHYLAFARNQKKQVSFENLSEAMQSIIKLSGLENLIL